MSKLLNKSILLIAIVVIITSIQGVAFAQKPKGPPPPAVVASPVRVETVKHSITIIGSIISPRESSVSSEGEGLISKVYVLEGDRVTEGSPLVRMVNSSIAILMDEAESTVKEAENRLKELRPLQMKIENDYKLNQKLFREKIINERILVNSKLEVEAAKEGISQAEFNIVSKMTKIALYKDQLKKLTITAPFSGVITEKIVAKGEWLKQGQQVIKVMETDPLWVEIPVPEKIVSNIVEGVKASVFIEAHPEHTFSAKVFRIIPKADRVSRTFPVRLLITNPKGALKAGMTAKVTLPYGQRKKVLMIPRDAITIKNGKKIVYALGENGAVKMFSVKTGTIKKGWTEVTSGGITKTDLVITRGGERLRPGQIVKVIKK